MRFLYSRFGDRITPKSAGTMHDYATRECFKYGAQRSEAMRKAIEK